MFCIFSFLSIVLKLKLYSCIISTNITTNFRIFSIIYIYMAKNYLNNKDLYRELVLSNQRGELTDEAVKMLSLLAINTTKFFVYKDEDDRQDAAADAMMQMLRRWKSFDCSYSNPFAFFTELCKKNHMLYFNTHIQPRIGQMDINNMFNL